MTKNSSEEMMTDIAYRLITLYDMYAEKGLNIHLKEYTELIETATDEDLLYFMSKRFNTSNITEVYSKAKKKILLNMLSEYIKHDILLKVERIERIKELNTDKILSNYLTMINKRSDITNP